MLRIYPVLLELVRFVRPLVKELERRDPDLARQCRRALSSAPLNVAEGSYSQGRNRHARYHNALGSLREALACFEVGAAMGYLPEVEATLRRRPVHPAAAPVVLVDHPVADRRTFDRAQPAGVKPGVAEAVERRDREVRPDSRHHSDR